MADINWTPIIVALIIVLGLGVIAGFYFNMKDGERTISATGNAQISVMPDKAIVYLQIQTRNESADSAKNMNSEVSQKALDALKAIGIQSSDIETENYNINPEYDWSDGKQTLLGYVASNTLKVSSTDFNNVGKIVDAAVDAGALVSYINFDLSNAKQNEYKAQVLANASQDAKAKAEAIANGLGKKLGGLVSVSGSDYNYMPYPLYSRAEASGVDLKQVTTNISPQKLEVSGTVSVTYSIK
jgi:hypothetical protein